MSRMQWSKQIVVRHIKMRHRNGQRLNSNYMQTNCRPLYLAGCKYYGSWRKSITAAGLSYDQVRVLKRTCLVWSEEKILASINLRNNLKQPLNSNHLQKKETRLYMAAIKYFGGWAQAIAAAGLNYSKLRKKEPMRRWSKTTIVKEILRRYRCGLSVRGFDVSQQDRGLYQAARRHFGEGGWAQARICAGFDPTDPLPWKIWDKKTVCMEIQRLQKIEIPLSTGSLRDSSYAYILSAASKVFGSWAKAIRESGLDYSKIRKGRQPGWWTKPRILMRIRYLEKLGMRLSHRSIQDSHCDLLGSAIAHFGCWSQAVESAGIPYQAHCRVWSTKAWLRRMQDDEYLLMLKKAKKHARKRSNK